MGHVVDREVAKCYALGRLFSTRCKVNKKKTYIDVVEEGVGKWKAIDVWVGPSYIPNTDHPVDPIDTNKSMKTFRALCLRYPIHVTDSLVSILLRFVLNVRFAHIGIHYRTVLIFLFP